MIKDEAYDMPGGYKDGWNSWNPHTVKHNQNIGTELGIENTGMIYACPMHPDEVSEKKGKCSICGMFLVAQQQDHLQHHDPRDRPLHQHLPDRPRP